MSASNIKALQDKRDFVVISSAPGYWQGFWEMVRQLDPARCVGATLKRDFALYCCHSGGIKRIA